MFHELIHYIGLDKKLVYKSSNNKWAIKKN